MYEVRNTPYTLPFHFAATTIPPSLFVFLALGKTTWQALLK